MKRSAVGITIFGCIAIAGASIYKYHLDTAAIQEYLGPQLPEPAHVARVGDRVKPLQLRDLNGQKFVLGGVTNRPVLVHFWASWCLPCVEELPSFEAAYSEFGRREITLLSVAQDDREHAQEIAKRYGVTFPVLLADGAAANPLLALGSARGAVPYDVLLSAQGVVLSQKLGAGGASDTLKWAKKIPL